MTIDQDSFYLCYHFELLNFRQCTRACSIFADKLGQKYFLLFCDEGVYRISRHIQLMYLEEFENLVILLGNFHAIKISLACLGKYLRYSGVEHILVESGVLGVEVIDQVLNGFN